MTQTFCGSSWSGSSKRYSERRGYRNGYKSRQLNTRVGTLTLQVPQDREGTFSTQLFARYQRSEKALVLPLMEMYVEGVSTRKVREITEVLCGTSFSKSLVSELAGQLDEELDAWRCRPLTETTYPYLSVDARYEHFARDLVGMVGAGRRRELAADLREIFAATTREQAMATAEAVAARWEASHPAVARLIEEGVEDCLACLAFPLAYRARIRTTNGLKRLNEEIKRRTRVMRIFPNPEACLRLVTVLCVEQSEEWVSGRRYLDMSGLCFEGRREEALAG